MMHILEHGTDVALNKPFKPVPGYWWRVGPNVWVCCPECGQAAGLDHEIADDGTVTPSLDCPNERCTFHESGVKLKDWKEEP